jgi:hypothetical protein
MGMFVVHMNMFVVHMDMFVVHMDMFVAHMNMFVVHMNMFQPRHHLLLSVLKRSNFRANRTGMWQACQPYWNVASVPTILGCGKRVNPGAAKVPVEIRGQRKRVRTIHGLWVS